MINKDVRIQNSGYEICEQSIFMNNPLFYAINSLKNRERFPVISRWYIPTIEDLIKAAKGLVNLRNGQFKDNHNTTNQALCYTKNNHKSTLFDSHCFMTASRLNKRGYWTYYTDVISTHEESSWSSSTFLVMASF